MAKSRIAARLARKWRASPQTQVHAIVRIVAEPEDVVSVLEQRGLKVVHLYRLLPAVAISGLAQDILSLADEDWVTSIEEDTQVHTM
jgi:hypothetical protein